MSITMECLGFFIAILVIISLLIGGGGGQRRGCGGAAAAYRQLATRYHGSYQRSGWFGGPSVIFKYRETRVDLLTITHPPAALGRRSVTGMTMTWPGAGLRGEVISPRRAGSRLPATGLQEMLVGSADFDQRYLVRASDAGRMCELLNDAVRWQIGRLRGNVPEGKLFVQVEPDRLQIYAGQLIRSAGQLAAFVEHALLLYDQALLTRTEGIAFVESSILQPLESVKCKVCGEEIADHLVYCQRCKTPHHRECWQYNGRCSVFGCGETHFRIPQIADRHDPAND